MDALDLAQGTAYTYVNRLVDTGVIEATSDDHPRRYVAREIDLTVTAADGTREYTITPALIDAVARRGTATSMRISTGTESLAGDGAHLCCRPRTGRDHPSPDGA